MEYKRGERETPPIIQLDVPERIRELLVQLARSEDGDARRIAFTLLDLSDLELMRAAEALSQAQEKAPSPGNFGCVSLRLRDLAMCVVTARGGFSQEVTNLRHVAMFEKYRWKVSRSIGLGIKAGDPNLSVRRLFWNESPWQHDAAMEKELAREAARRAKAEGHEPGRNDPCVCGSGKKYKKCCLPRMGGLSHRPRRTA
jgi:hypothetical protein